MHFNDVGDDVEKIMKLTSVDDGAMAKSDSQVDKTDEKGGHVGFVGVASGQRHEK